MNTIGSYQCIMSTTDRPHNNKNNNNNNNNNNDEEEADDEIRSNDVIDDDDDVTLCETGYTFDTENNICVDDDLCERFVEIFQFRYLFKLKLFNAMALY